MRTTNAEFVKSLVDQETFKVKILEANFLDEAKSRLPDIELKNLVIKIGMGDLRVSRDLSEVFDKKWNTGKILHNNNPVFEREAGEKILEVFNEAGFKKVKSLGSKYALEKELSRVEYIKLLEDLMNI